MRGDGILIMITWQHADCTNLRKVSLPDILHSSFSYLPINQSINQSTFKVAKDRLLKKPSFVPESITTRLSTSKIIQMYEKIQQHIDTLCPVKRIPNIKRCNFKTHHWILILLWRNRNTHPFNGPFSGTTRVSRYQKGITNLDFNEARDRKWQWQWHQLGHMQVCT